MANPSPELEMTTAGNYPPGSIEAMLVDHLKRSLNDPCYFRSKPGGRFYVNARTACAAALARRLDPQTDRGVLTMTYKYSVG